MERHIHRATLVIVYNLLHGCPNLSLDEFVDVSTAGDLRGISFKIHQPGSYHPRMSTAICLDANWSSVSPDLDRFLSHLLLFIHECGAKVLLLRPVNLTPI